MARAWYTFIGKDPANVLDYYRLSVKHQCLCGNVICAVNAREDGLHPADPFSPNIQQYIRDALITGQLQPELPMAKKYVYMKY